MIFRSESVWNLIVRITMRMGFGFGKAAIFISEDELQRQLNYGRD
jgi:hypothetical protein